MINMSRRNAPAGTSFGLRLALLRKKAGYTQVQLARELGITRAKLAYYEGLTELPLTILLRDLTQALNVDADELLGLASHPAGHKKPPTE
jgi:transcriptional regulator with XRE-family HTH domain